MIKVILCLIIGAGSFALVLRAFLRNFKEIKRKKKMDHTMTDYLVNYPLSFVWYGYLMILSLGLIVNNLLFD